MGVGDGRFLVNFFIFSLIKVPPKFGVFGGQLLPYGFFDAFYPHILLRASIGVISAISDDFMLIRSAHIFYFVHKSQTIAILAKIGVFGELDPLKSGWYKFAYVEDQIRTETRRLTNQRPKSADIYW